MTTLFRLDSSPRKESSHSREIADLVEQHLQSITPNLTIQRRDLADTQIPSLSDVTINGFFTPSEEQTLEQKHDTALSDELIAELKSTHTLLISAPMYNFGVPASLKAWIDQVSRINETFAYDGVSFSGLLPTKRAILTLAYGAEGYAEGGELSAMNFFEPFLTSLLSFLGIKEIHVIRLEGTSTATPEQLALKKEQLAMEIKTLVRG
ncbi:NAD(P)H-dependent oxidoreductase [Marinomonas sp. C2222]|uniref:FMN dependent NADH:quinone oxidoreductase n=1 Tax=Marinomonas sargassi TaxID=2984494 RepID=A0ABT2YVA5_9GAMM|nr:NAD(P)H-dependent oxidoreductase [Marinomonas sargassi]MCV2403514.1 NAD(P)H-dependent oxidoreductase [Marinomonas sargassi]